MFYLSSNMCWHFTKAFYYWFYLYFSFPPFWMRGWTLTRTLQHKTVLPVKGAVTRSYQSAALFLPRSVKISPPVPTWPSHSNFRLFFCFWQLLSRYHDSKQPIYRRLCIDGAWFFNGSMVAIFRCNTVGGHWAKLEVRLSSNFVSITIQEQFVQYLAQGHFDMQTRGIEPATFRS